MRSSAAPVALALALAVGAARGQTHVHPAGAPAETTTFLVEGLRVDPAAPPSGSAVAAMLSRVRGRYVSFQNACRRR